MEKTILKISEFSTPIDNLWYVTGTSQKAGWKWRYIPNMLKLNVEDYIKLLHRFKAINLRYYVPTDFLSYCFKTKEDAHKWVLYVNKKAREIGYCW